jgi:hypothetical protein
MEDYCTFIYGSLSGWDGTCVDKGTTLDDCGMIKREGQCSGGGEITSLSDTCEWYLSKCDVKCSEITSEETCKSTRSSDCFWIEKNGTTPTISCVDRVFYCVLLALLLFFFFLSFYHLFYFYCNE